MFKNRTLRLKNAVNCTISRKALRLVVQLEAISKDHSCGINMCVGCIRVMSDAMFICNFLKVVAHRTV